MTWYNTDPRLAIYKRADIVLYYFPLKIIGTGQVETKNGWSINSSIEKFKRIGDGDDWPNEDLVWTYSPKKEFLEENIHELYKDKI